MSVFKLKQFNITQHNSAMKVGTDGMLLGAIATHPSPTAILDVGCGTGLIGLMLAQRFKKAHVSLIDIDSGALNDTRINCDNSPFSKRLTYSLSDFAAFKPSTAFDLIVSNPPYHIEDPKAKNHRRDIARHAQHLPMDVFFNKAYPLLSDTGRITLVLPYDYFDHAQKTSEVVGLYCVHRHVIKSKKNKPANRIIATWQAQKAPFKEDNLILRDLDGAYSASYRNLTKDFHIMY